MSHDHANRLPKAAVALLLAVGLLVLLQVGMLISKAAADIGGGTSATTVTPDAISDEVAATAAEFRVDESGAATYSIPLYAVPGAAGVSPKLSLQYSSQGGYGSLGKGWSLGGLSAITRCRATRESGDFIVNGVPTDGNPSPINFSASDRYCLNGQRLLPAQAGTAGCPAIAGMAAQNLRTEIESFQRICAYTPTGGTTGPAFFTVDGKDGSSSWYGDRDNDSTSNRPDGYFNSTAPGMTGFALSWAQTRFQDSNGNYIDYLYYENADNVVGEQLIKEIQYTGKTVLPGQSGTAQAPFARVLFTYGLRAAADQRTGYSSGGVLTQAHRLNAITSCATAGGCYLAYQARRYNLGYEKSASGSGLETLTSLQECKDSNASVCLPPTTFDWSTAKFDFATKEYPPNLPTGSASKFEGFKMADVDGDGRQDIVYLQDGSSGDPCPTETVYVLYATMDAAGNLSYTQSGGICTPAELMSGRGEGSWHLFDYDGDGRDDLFVSAATGSGWRIYPSQGRSGNSNFDTSRNLLSTMAGTIPSFSGKDDQAQLADLNGDGLTDVIYPVTAGLRARIMERQGNSYGWGAERQVQLDMSTLGPITDSRCSQLDYTCTRYLSGRPSTKTGFMQLADFNGDASSDLLMGVDTNIVYTGTCTSPGPYPPTPQLTGDTSRYKFQRSRRRASLLSSCPPEVDNVDLYALSVNSITSGVVTIAAYAKIGGKPDAISLADVNGDGLTDIFYRPTSSSEWSYRINTGTGMGLAIQLPLQDFEDQVQFADANGDGRTDVLHVYNGIDYKAYNVLYADASGGFGAEVNLPGGNALLCEGYKCDNTLKAPIFADFDGDGSLDFLSIKIGGDNADLLLSRSSSRAAPRDVISTITNGLGAVTSLAYAPLTNAAVYRRDYQTRDQVNWGRGAPVQDLLAPSYVVWRASSSSPQAGNSGAMASVYYRYAGAKVQAGGRGFLGFREIVTSDTNETGGYVTTQTTYAQNFPFIGMPMATVKRAVIGQTYVVSTCLKGPPGDACFAAPGDAFATLPGSWFSSNSQVWESDTDNSATSAEFDPGVRAPVHVRTAGTDETLRDPINAVTTSRVVTTFSYGAYGNVAATTADTYSGGSTLVSTVLTANTYADNASAWRLGRLATTTVTHRRPNLADSVRTTSFGYSMGGAITGQLTAEEVQPGGAADQDLRKEYSYDERGNRIRTETCAGSTTCPSAIAFHPSGPGIIQRYSRTAYDASGRYPVATYEPFWNGAGASEQITQTVVSRNLFGDVTQAYDLNGHDTLAVTGALGRAYYTWSETVPGSVPGAVGGGVESLTTYRWCGTGSDQVSCPTGAKFRQKVAADGAPTAWTYFDLLGRPILKVAQSFNDGVSGKDASAVCTTYDATGKPKQVSNPFFLAGTVAGDPANLTSVCTSGRAWTTTTYDILGRPTDVQAVDGSVTSTDYVGSQTILTDARGNATTQTRNGLGELVQVTDANGLTVVYWYLADGSNYLVTRDAGRGAVENRFFFDEVGRKVKQVDPDSGTTYFEYNALGELTAQQDAEGNRIENEIDARGRIWRKTVKAVDGTIESRSTYNFDTAPNGIGQMASEAITGTYAGWVGQSGVALDYLRTYAYDSLGRPAGSTTGIDGVNYTAVVQYDAFGRPWKAQDVSGRWAKSVYDNRGMVESVCESSASDDVMACAADASTYVRTLETDAWGHTIRERRGNSAAMDVTRQYWSDDGRIAQICAGNTTTCNLMKEMYAWDSAGNLSTQQKENRYLEEFSYDSLNRLTLARMTMQGGVTSNVLLQQNFYDALGNLCRRMTQGWATRDYTYIGRAGCGLGGNNSTYGGGGTGIVGPHQASALVSGTDSLFYYYDPRGNSTVQDAPSASADRTILYSLDDKAYEARMATGQRVRFWYGSDGQRYKREDGSKRTLYLGNVEIVTDGGATTIKRTVAGVMLQTIVGAVSTNYYLFHDQLGSLARITNATGGQLTALDYTAMGARRDPDTQLPDATSPTTLTTRGYTGHEMVDGLNIVHMNGRIYDNYVGRFLQADPVIQAPGNTQSWNAYTYVFNNPYAYTDPTGLIGQTEREWLGAIIVIVAAIFAPYVAPYLKFAYAVAVGAIAGGVTTGTWQGAIYGAFSAALFYGIGSYFQQYSEVNEAANAESELAGGGEAVSTVGDTGLTWGEFGAKVLAHGAAGGVMAKLEGGKFGNGFVAAGLTEAGAPAVDGIGAGNDSYAPARVAAAAVVGGTSSLLTGGKFANGALTAAFSRAFNEGLHPHDYERTIALCYTNEWGCSLDEMTSLGLDGSAPFTSRLPPDTVVMLPSMWSLVGVPVAPDNPIMQHVDWRTHTITNTAQKGHVFTGTVTHHFFEAGGTIYETTQGLGANRSMFNSIANEVVGYAYFLGAYQTGLIMRARQYVRP